jgi:DNA repair exonuclease SbcCD ATPase subunit
MTETDKKETGKGIDYLREDEPISNQKFVCVSFVSPEGIKNCTLRALKIRGVFATKEEADKHSKDLTELDPDFDVFVGEVGKWLPWDPEPNSVADQVYQEKELNDLMKGYKDNMDKAKKMQSQRKSDMIKEAAIEQQMRAKGSSEVKERLQKKLLEKKQQKKMNALAEKQVEKEQELKEHESKVNEKLESLNETKAKLQEKQNLLASGDSKLDDKLDKIQKLYNKLNKKPAAP